MKRTETDAQPFLPHYEILDMLGEGAVATVYRVKSRRDDNVYALKALRAQQAEKQAARRRFADEFRLLEQLRHPGVPRVFDYGSSTSKVPFIVMELVRGEPLDVYLRSHESQLWILIYQLSETLAFVHEHGLLHLDLKPDNILVETIEASTGEEQPVVNLIDFGMSYERRSGGGVRLVGTPAYMAPEVIRGDEQPTRAVDYYSLGVILYELVEKDLPFGGNFHEIMQGHLTGSVQFNETKVEYAELYPWIERLLSKHPQPRLEAFQQFRRLCADRAAIDDDVDQRYARGYIDSIGTVGKQRVCDGLYDWIRAIERDAGLQRPASRPVTSKRAKHRVGRPIEASGLDSLLTDSVEPIDKRIEIELLSTAQDHDGGASQEPAPSRYLAVVGPPASGKSYLLERLRARALPCGFSVVRLGDNGDYSWLTGGSAVAAGRHVNAEAVVVDRFREAWNRLRRLSNNGVIVVAEHTAMLEDEQREFLSYLVKRIQLERPSADQRKVYVVFADEPSVFEKDAKQFGIPEGVVSRLDLTPPSRTDAESIGSLFHGRMSSTEERRALVSYLDGALGSTGMLFGALRRALTEGALRYRKGRWYFDPRASEEPRLDESSESYYAAILKVLPEQTRELLNWLSAHPAQLPVTQIAEISAMDSVEIERAVATIRPYGLIDLAQGDEEFRVGFVNEGIRTIIHRLVAEDERTRIHEIYIAYLSGYQDVRAASLEILAYHYEQAGDVRNALLTRVRAIRQAKRKNDVFAVRRLCEQGLKYVAREPSLNAACRYFLKLLSDYHRSRHDYSAILDLLRAHYQRKNVPAALAYKYALALERCGREAELKDFVAPYIKDQSLTNPKTRNQLMLVLSEHAFTASQYDKVIALSASINVNVLAPPERVALYTCLTLTNEGLGARDEARRYHDLASQIARSRNDEGALARLAYLRVYNAYTKGSYKRAKILITRTVRRAVRAGDYRSLCGMYFLASAVYYEEGNYTKTLRHLDKAIDLATDIGMSEQANNYQLRYGLVYQNMGRYGDAIRHVESIRAHLSPDYLIEQYFFAVLILLDLHLTIDSHDRVLYRAEADQLAPGVQVKYRVALYHQLVGKSERQSSNYSAGIEHYDRAAAIYQEVGYNDDYAMVQIEKARLLVAEGNIEEADRILKESRSMVNDLEASDVQAEYIAVALECAVARGASREHVGNLIEECGAVRQQTKAFNARLAIEMALLKAFDNIEANESLMETFGRYYGLVKSMCSNLRYKQYVDAYIKGREFQEMLSIFRRAKARSSGPT